MGSRRERFAAVMALVISSIGTISAADFSIGAMGVGTTEAAASSDYAKKVFGETFLSFDANANGLGMVGAMDLSTEGTYPAPFMGGFYGSFSPAILEGGLTYRNGPLAIGLGKLEAKDTITTRPCRRIFGMRTIISASRIDG